MAIQRVAVITGTQRRRQFTDAEKLRLVEEAFQPGVKATEYARQHGVDVSLLYRWRRQFFGRPPRLPAFTPVTVSVDDAPPVEPGPPVTAPMGMVEIECALGARMRITGPVDPAVVTAALVALAGRSA